MTHSITQIRQRLKRRQKRSFRLWAIIVLLALWQGIAMLVGQEILLASPAAVFVRLWTLIFQESFWRAIEFTMIRIVGGFFFAMIVGVICAALAARFIRVAELLDPLMAVIKATPVASITIVILLWVSSSNLSLILSIMMVLPIMYDNVKSGIANTNRELLEMTQVFRVPLGRRLRFVYIPEVLSYFHSACKISIGLCWKAGIAAEVIGIPTGSIGEKLYQAKIYLETASVFAWTLVIILLSVLFEKLFLLFLNVMIERLVKL